jgi:hypothetical protein
MEHDWYLPFQLQWVSPYRYRNLHFIGSVGGVVSTITHSALKLISVILIKMWRFLRSSQIASPGSVRNCTAAAVAFIATTSHNNVSALTTFWNLIAAKVPCCGQFLTHIFTSLLSQRHNSGLASRNLARKHYQQMQIVLLRQ